MIAFIFFYRKRDTEEHVGRGNGVRSGVRTFQSTVETPGSRRQIRNGGKRKGRKRRCSHRRELGVREGPTEGREEGGETITEGSRITTRLGFKGEPPKHPQNQHGVGFDFS